MKNLAIKKVCVLCLALLLCAMHATAQRKVVVAVVGAHEDQAINEMLSDELLLAFVRSNLYVPLENNEAFLAALNKEMAYSRSGAVSDDDIIDLGMFYGAQFICIVRIVHSPTLNTNQVTARMIDAKTRALVSMERHRSPLTAERHVTETATTLAKTLSDKTAKEKNEDERQQQEAAARARAAQAEAERREREKRDAEERRQRHMREDGYTEFRTLAVQLKPSSNDVTWGTAKGICSGSKRGNLSGWRLPTVGELSRLYDNQYDIFGTRSYFDNLKIWSSGDCENGKGHTVVGEKNKKDCFRKVARCLCVRDIK